MAPLLHGEAALRETGRQRLKLPEATGKYSGWVFTGSQTIEQCEVFRSEIYCKDINQLTSKEQSIRDCPMCKNYDLLLCNHCNRYSITFKRFLTLNWSREAQ